MLPLLLMIRCLIALYWCLSGLLVLDGGVGVTNTVLVVLRNACGFGCVGCI